MTRWPFVDALAAVPCEEIVAFARSADHGWPERFANKASTARTDRRLTARPELGPVLHPDDVMAGKVDALCNRAAARDFLDVDAAISGGHYTLDRLCEIAHEADPGFDRRKFAAMLGLIGRLDDHDDFAVYGVTPDYLTGLRQRVADWRVRSPATDQDLADRPPRWAAVRTISSHWR
ncbi:hypothetical protein [Pseudofrankia sp. DC12]|uniref:hypothetical protein n=1 Tax=Pseudofrankia sp. DC12 TaxID=683315 RepID=UPI0018DE6F4A|nr:hypothetical protein [Pseudofrankia sp. DC12]